MISILHTVAGLHPDSGGPARTVTSLCGALSGHSHVDMRLLTQRVLGEDVYKNNLGSTQLLLAQTRSKLMSKMGLMFREKLIAEMSHRPADILHDHGVWLPNNHHSATQARRYCVPYVVHTRGMLEPWSLSHRAYKKKIAWSLYQKKNLESAALFFATSQAEADNLRMLGLAQPIAVIPNGVYMSYLELPLSFSQIAQRERNVVFMSRVHPKKGIKGLLEAWTKLDADNWKLNLVGPDEDGHLHEVLRHAKKLRIEDKVVYRGVMEGEEKQKLLLNADLFILPSFSENFGVVVAEALACGVPVISTFGTPWGGLVEKKCGWWVAAEPEALAGALGEAMALTDEERREMGARGREYAKEFDWDQIARETADVYRWLLGKADRPDCVRLD